MKHFVPPPRRSPAAARYDRRAILAMTAGQIVAAQALGIRVSAIVVGRSDLADCDVVARDVQFATPPLPRQAVVIGYAATLALVMAVGQPPEAVAEGISPEAQALVDEAAGYLEFYGAVPFMQLIEALDGLRIPGVRSLTW